MISISIVVSNAKEQYVLSIFINENEMAFSISCCSEEKEKEFQKEREGRETTFVMQFRFGKETDILFALR